MGLYDALAEPIPVDPDKVAAVPTPEPVRHAPSGDIPMPVLDAEPVPAPSNAMPQAAPQTALAAETAEGLSEEDRKLAVSISRDLDRWELSWDRRQGELTNELRERQLKDLMTAQRGRFRAPDAAIMAYIRQVREGLFGLEAYLSNPLVSDILLNDADELFVEERGELERRVSPIGSREELKILVQRLVNKTGGSIDMARPVLDDQFEFLTPSGKQNVRVNINLGTLSVTGAPVISLRKQVASGFDRLETWTKITEGESDAPLTPEAARFLDTAFRARASILVVGGTGSGKTSLLRALLRAIRPNNERVIVVEEANELDLRGIIDNYVGLVATQADNQRIGSLVKSAMRMRPDRIVVGECREPAEVDAFLRAINTGHAGSITTIHAQSARDGLQALLTLAAQNTANKSSVEHVGRLIHPGIDLVVYLSAQYVKLPDGRQKRIRRIMEIATINEFRVVDGAPDFALQYPFGRFVGPTRKVVEIGAPLMCGGFASLSDTFVARMRTQGVSEEALRALLDGAARGGSR
jgi:pilus assembly protein CpaF